MSYVPFLSDHHHSVYARLTHATLSHHLIMLARRQGMYALLLDVVGAILCLIVSSMTVWDGG